MAKNKIGDIWINSNTGDTFVWDRQWITKEEAISRLCEQDNYQWPPTGEPLIQTPFNGFRTSNTRLPAVKQQSFSDKLLSTPVPNMIHRIGATWEKLPKTGGATLRMRRYDNLEPKIEIPSELLPYKKYFAPIDPYVMYENDGESARFIYIPPEQQPLATNVKVGYRFNEVPRIMNDEWLVNLRPTHYPHDILYLRPVTEEYVQVLIHY